MASRRVLDLYLEKSFAEGTLPESAVRELVNTLSDGAALRAKLANMDDPTLEQVLERLEDYKNEFTPAQAATAVPVLLNQWPRLRHVRRTIDDLFGPDIRTIRVALRMLERVEDQAERERIVEDSLRAVDSLSARLDLLRSVGNEKDVGAGLIPEELEQKAAKQIEEEILSAPPKRLASERDLDQLVEWIQKRKEEAASGWLESLRQDRRTLIALLRRHRWVPSRLRMGDVAGREGEPQLVWSALCSYFGEAKLIEAVNALELPVAPPEDREAVELAKRHAGGWHPDAL